MNTHKTQSGSVTAVRGTAKAKESAMFFAKKTVTWMMVSALLLLTAILPGCDLGETVNPPVGTNTVTKTDAGNNDGSGEEVEITFDLPEQWRPAEQSGGGDLYWSTYIPSEIVYATPPEVMPDEREQQHYWSFYLLAYGIDGRFGNFEAENAKDAATEYYETRSGGCEEVVGCFVESVTEETYAGIPVYVVRTIDRSDRPMFFGEYANYFFEKDGYFFNFGLRGFLDDPIAAQTVQKVMDTITIRTKKGSE